VVARCRRRTVGGSTHKVHTTIGQKGERRKTKTGNRQAGPAGQKKTRKEELRRKEQPTNRHEGKGGSLIL